jgi:hypothetical protein
MNQNGARTCPSASLNNFFWKIIMKIFDAKLLFNQHCKKERDEMSNISLKWSSSSVVNVM